MIDIENLVFDTMYSALATEDPTLDVSKGYNEETAPSRCVTVREIGNVPVESMNTDECAENYTRVTYEVEAYSDKQDTARSECRDLLKKADAVMQGMKFRRIYLSEPLRVNRTRYRQYARDTAIVQAGITVGENTVFHMYRR